MTWSARKSVSVIESFTTWIQFNVLSKTRKIYFKLDKINCLNLVTIFNLLFLQKKLSNLKAFFNYFY